MPARLSVLGEDETRQNLENISRALHGDGMVNTMYRAANLLQRDAKKFAPRDTGRLANSITSQVRSVGFSRRVEGVVGSNVEYAPMMEGGTEHNVMPPVAALEGWARRHNMNAYIVARAILRNGGLAGRFYFQRSLDKNRQQVFNILKGHVELAIRINS